MNIGFHHIVGIVLLAALFGCQPASEPVDAVVTVYGKSLTWDEVRAAVPDHSLDEDSVLRANSFIHQWIKEQVVLARAEKNLSDDQMNFEKELEAYRNSLLIYAFENQVVRQKLDTLVSEAEIEEYYQENIENFELKDYILRVKYCILDSTTTVSDEFLKLFASDDAEDLVLFEQFCVDNRASYFIDEEKWLYLSNLLVEVPMQVYQPETFLKKNKSIHFQRDKHIYFLRILDYKLKDSVSPVSLQRDKIRNTILNKRKIALLSKMRDDLYEEALRKKQIDINYE